MISTAKDLGLTNSGPVKVVECESHRYFHICLFVKQPLPQRAAASLFSYSAGGFRRRGLYPQPSLEDSLFVCLDGPWALDSVYVDGPPPTRVEGGKPIFEYLSTSTKVP